MENNNKFSSKMGFIFAAAGSAVGVGNLWRFPYLAAKDGGGLFLLIYLLLVLTIGFTLLTSDIAIGRRSGKSAIYAYKDINPKWSFLGILTFIVPVIIMTYYAVIGGWILKYIFLFLTNQVSITCEPSYFSDFISLPSSVFPALLFMFITAYIVFNGVQEGIEKVSKIMMPILLILVLGIAVYSLTLSNNLESVIRTGLEGLKIYLTPDFTGLSFSRFMEICLDAMSQLFFSLSVSMGIMITYGSYVKKDVNLNKSICLIEIMDTVVALLAGAMIIPAVYVFSGIEGMSAGPGLMFISLPKVFIAMGKTGTIVGAIFFILAGFAALTSCISVLESIVANFMELFKWSRKKSTCILSIFYLFMSAIIALGYSVFYIDVTLPNGNNGQLLDIMDYLSNSFLMPLIAFMSSIFIGWVVKPQYIIDEVEYGGHIFKRKHIYSFMIKYVVPLIMILLFITSTGILK